MFFLYLLKNSNKNVFQFLIGISPIIYISTLKGFVGTDSENYYNFFERINTDLTIYLSFISSWEFLEPLYFILNYTIKYLNLPFSFLLFSVSILNWTLFFLVIRKYEFKSYQFVFVAVTIGYLFFTFNGVRQSISIAFMFYSIIFFLDKKYFGFIFFYIVSILFHFSSIIFLPFILLSSNIKLKFDWMLFLFLIFLFLPSNFFYYLVGLIVKNLGFYTSYYQTIINSNSELITFGVLLNILIWSISFIYFYPLYNTRFNVLIYNMSFIGLLFYVMFYSNPIINRIVIVFYYFILFKYLLIFNYLKFMKKNNTLNLLYFFMFVILIINIFTNSSGNNPYIFS